MLDPSSFLPRLAPALQQALSAMPALSADRLLSITLPLPLPADAQAFPEGDGPWFFWFEPELRRRRLGLGSLPIGRSRGPSRLPELEAQLAEAGKLWRHQDPESTGQRPLLALVFAFDPDDPMEEAWTGLPNALLTLPELLLRQDGARWTLTFSARSGRADLFEHWMRLAARLPACLTPPARPPLLPVRLVEEPERTRWLHLAQEAARATAQPRLEKIVLARRVRLEAHEPFATQPLLSGLGREYPGCHLFAAALDDRVLVSASPERLLSCHAGRLRCDAIGGTLPKSAEFTPAGKSPGAKLLREHRLVVDAIRRELEPMSQQLSYPPQPRVLRLRDLQHLWTEIQARYGPSHSLLSLGHRLHPTPAVNGSPRQAALAWLREREPFRRGWYSGGGGWIDSRGDGDLAVLLRCALLRGRHAELYAGAGILAESDPESEFAETELKLRTMLQALKAVPHDAETRFAAAK